MCCLKVACETGMARVCKSFCRECIKTGQVCEEHTGLFDTWNLDEHQCNQCTEYSFNGNSSSSLIQLKKILKLSTSVMKQKI